MTILTPSESTGSGAWAELKADVYDAELTAIEDIGISPQYPDSGPRFKLVFTLDRLDESGERIQLFDWCSQKLTTGSKQSNLWTLAEALGAPPQKGVPYDVQAQLVGKRCRIVVNMKDTANGPRPDVANVLPSAQRSGAPPAAAPQPTADVDVCGVPGCGQPLARYDDKGIPLCEGHSG